MTTDISDFYLSTPLKQWEYVKLNLCDIPQEVTAEYNLHAKAVDGHVYVKVRNSIMASRNLASWRMSSLKRSSRHSATGRADWSLDYGSTIDALYNSL